MHASISLHSRVTPIKEQVSCDLSDEVVILNVATGQYFGLNPTGARIWQLLQEGRAVLEVRDLLLAEYADADSDRCTLDLLNLLAELADAGLVLVAE
jgi:hypothetical protein